MKYDIPYMTTEAVSLLKSLISIPSISREETQAADFLQNYIEMAGMQTGRKGNNVWCFSPMFDLKKPTILLNSHIDTVKPVNGWRKDPFTPREENGKLYGLGSNDAGASVVSLLQVFLQLCRTSQKYNLIYLASCEEEVSGKDGIESVLQGLPPVSFAIVGEPTEMQPAIAEKGLMVLDVTATGKAGHAARNEGDNAIYKMADIIADVRALNNNGCDESTDIKGLVKMLSPKYNPEHYEDAQFLGRGTCTVSQIFYTSPSRCAVADSCAISIDRRMTAGETWDSCLDEIRALPSVQKYGDDVKVSMYMYDRPSWTGEVYETECYFPTWINKENAAHVQALVDAHKGLFGDKRMGPDSTKELRNRPLIDKWTFSTNGVAIQGRYGIPCVGFGPGAESQAHAPNEITYKDDLVRCAAVYVAAANLYNEDNKTDDVSQFRAGKTNNDIK